jgi:putative transposase
MSVPGTKRLKDLEAEDTRLEKLLAEQVFENDVFYDALRRIGGRAGAQAAGAM